MSKPPLFGERTKHVFITLNQYMIGGDYLNMFSNNAARGGKPGKIFLVDKHVNLHPDLFIL